MGIAQGGRAFSTVGSRGRNDEVPPWAELQVSSNFSFSEGAEQGASHPEELLERAASYGTRYLALTDYATLAGVVRAQRAWRQLREEKEEKKRGEQEDGSTASSTALRFIVGCRLPISARNHQTEQPCAQADIQEALLPFSLLVYPSSIAAYAKLARLLTLRNMRQESTSAQSAGPVAVRRLSIHEFIAASAGLLTIVVPYFQHPAYTQQENVTLLAKHLQLLRQQLVPENMLSLALTRLYGPKEDERERQLVALSQEYSIPLVVTNDVYYHDPARKPLQDVLTCIRAHCTLDQAGLRLSANAERHLKRPAEIYRRYQDQPQALRRALQIAECAAQFSLTELRYEYPTEVLAGEPDARQYLRKLVLQGARQHFGACTSPKVAQQIEQELQLIHELGYEKYFLTCFDIVRFARSKGILCQGRGAAANSVVCFCLGITSVNPEQIDLLFARFVSKERQEPPDIDIDFEHERREEVIQYIYQKYGRERAALTCEVVCYRQRSAVREVGKVFGLSLEVVDRLAKAIHRWTDGMLDPQELVSLGINPSDATLRVALQISHELEGFPRHISQHVGGFVISQAALCEIVPLQYASMPERSIIEWDKDDIEELGMLKIDILALGMLSCIRKALEYCNARSPERPRTLASIPADDPAVYEMLCRADTIGVFQVESRAQMSMLVRLRPRCFYDLVIEVAIVRPGPLQGNMVHPYLRRRMGEEQVSFPDQRVREILGKTLGVPLFQEQAMRLAIVLAQFDPGEAEMLRRAIAAWKKNKLLLGRFQERVVRGMLQSGYSQAFADTCMQQIKGFSEYGFPESHAASFALLVYVSAWLKHHHPAEFLAAILNSQPMGFYGAAQLIADAQQHAVEVLPLDVNYSAYDCLVTGKLQVRLGLRLIKGLERAQVALLEQIVRQIVQRCGPCRTIAQLWFSAQETYLERRTLELLAKADAFQSMQLSTRQALWEIRALPEQRTPLEALSVQHGSQQQRQTYAPAAKIDFLPVRTMQQRLFADYQSTGCSLRGHPLGFLRQKLRQHSTTDPVYSVQQLRQRKRTSAAYAATGKKFEVRLAGLAIVRQRPGTAKGVVFVSLEDETGIANLVIFPQVFEQYRNLIMTSSCLLVRGTLEQASELVYVNAQQIECLDHWLRELSLPAKVPGRNYSY
jgi:error-prone DNA polymerase